MSTDPTAGRPPIDPAVGQAAEQEAEGARDSAETSLADGSLDLAGLFQQGATPGPIGHMHVKAALIALPHIDQVKADRILAETGIDGTHHIDQLGTEQQQALINAAANV